jgi:hypothetical protein
MTQPASAEDQDTGQNTRFDVAASALMGMLNDLSLDPDANVGVVLFGHRAGWSTRRPLQVLRQEAYAQPIPEDLLPSRDVETILSLGRFDTIEAGRVFRTLRSVRPWGQSPLYYAVVEALRSFANAGRDLEKHVVVITDGSPYQFTPPGGDAREQSPFTFDELVQAWQGTDAAVHVVWFGPDAGENLNQSQDFASLAERTGGSVTTAQNSKQLLDAIRDRLGKALYFVEDDQGLVLNRDPSADTPGTRLNLPVVIQPFSRDTVYSVRFRGITKALNVEGGEALQLQVTADGDEILAGSISESTATMAALVQTSDNAPVGYNIGVEPLVRLENSVRLRIWVQSLNTVVTPRPAEAWIELLPVAQGELLHHRKYIFFDRNFEPNTAVPTLEWTANDWPANADTAQLHIWLKPSPTTPAQIIPVANVVDTPQDFAASRAITGMPDIKYRAQLRENSQDGTIVLSVIQEHAQTAGSVDFLRVDLGGQASDVVQRIVHRMDHEHAIATHSFVVASADRDRLLETEIRFVRQADAIRGSWGLTSGAPLVLGLSRGGDVLEVP